MQSRRDFLKLCAVLGLSYTIHNYSSDIRQVFAQLAEKKVHLIWLPAAGDSGCTISMLQASNPDLIDAVSELKLAVDFWQPLMTPDYDLGWVSAGYDKEDNAHVPLVRAPLMCLWLKVLFRWGLRRAVLKAATALSENTVANP